MELNKELARKIQQNKDISTIDRLKLEGQILAHKNTIKVLNNSIKLEYYEEHKTLENYTEKQAKETNPNTYDVIRYLENELTKLEEQVAVHKAIEKISEKMDSDLIDILHKHDVTELLQEAYNDGDEMVKRFKNKDCCYRRFGKDKFPCDNKVVKGQKYCKTHLKQFDIVAYTEIFGED
jgi:hypothetical protein